MNILVDSGFLIALFASSVTDKHHDSAVLARKKYWNAKLHTLWECVAEASHQLNTQGRKALLEWLARARAYCYQRIKRDVAIHDKIRQCLKIQRCRHNRCCLSVFRCKTALLHKSILS